MKDEYTTTINKNNVKELLDPYKNNEYLPANIINPLIINTFDSVKTNSTILNYLISKRCTQLIECAEEFNSL